MGGSGENSGLQAHRAVAPALLLTFMCSGQQALGNMNWYQFFGEFIIDQVFFHGLSHLKLATTPTRKKLGYREGKNLA